MYAMHFPLVHQRYTRTKNNEPTHQTRVSVTDASGGPTAWKLPNQGIMGAEFQTTRRLLLVVVHGPLPTFNIRYRVEQSSFISFTSLFHSIISAISSPPSSAPLPFTGRHRRFFSLALIVRSSSSTAHSSHFATRGAHCKSVSAASINCPAHSCIVFILFLSHIQPYSFLSY